MNLSPQKWMPARFSELKSWFLIAEVWYFQAQLSCGLISSGAYLKYQIDYLEDRLRHLTAAFRRQPFEGARTAHCGSPKIAPDPVAWLCCC